MRIGILTQPLVNNYGGTLQNYALQTVLKRLGHTPITFDYIPKSGLKEYLLSCIKTIGLFFFPSKRRSFKAHPRRKLRSSYFEEFTKKYIKTSSIISSLSSSLINKYSLDAIIVGSDQVWRPKFNPKVENLFLSFLKNDEIVRLSYGASFGTDTWEFTEKQTSQIRELVKKFNGISVREMSGVELCKKYLNVNAIQVLDPTLLLTDVDYMSLCSNIDKDENSFILAYILDMTPEKFSAVEQLENTLGINAKVISAEKDASLSVEEWLAQFRDASFVITDSYHGTVFSIIFNKEFKCLNNESRGSSRFETLFTIFNNNDISNKKEESISFLKEHLNNV